MLLLLWPLFLLLSFSSASSELDRFVMHVNLLRLDPFLYQSEYNTSLACAPAADMLQPLAFSPRLNASASFQAEAVSHSECPVSHSTCPGQCDRFGGSCGYTERIAGFLGYAPSHLHAAEVLTQGPRHPMTSLALFFQSPEHCTILLDPAMDSIATAYADTDRNVFVADLATLGRHASRPQILGARDGDRFVAYTFYTDPQPVFWVVNDTEHVMSRMWDIRGLYSHTAPLGDSALPYFFRHGDHRSILYSPV